MTNKGCDKVGKENCKGRKDHKINLKFLELMLANK